MPRLAAPPDTDSLKSSALGAEPVQATRSGCPPTKGMQGRMLPKGRLCGQHARGAHRRRCAWQSWQARPTSVHCFHEETGNDLGLLQHPAPEPPDITLPGEPIRMRERDLT